MPSYLLTTLMIAGGASAAAPSADLDRFAATLGYRVTVIDNRAHDCPPLPGAVPAPPPSDAPTPPRRCSVVDIDLITPAGIVPPAGLEIHTSIIGRVLALDSAEFDTRYVNGDVSAFVAKSGVTLRPGQRYRLRLTVNIPLPSRSYIMPNAWVVAPGAAPVVIAATRPGTDPDTGLETLPYVTPLTDEARLATTNAEDRNVWLSAARAFDRYAARGAAVAAPNETRVAILPLPAQVRRPDGAPLDLTRGVRIATKGVSRAAIGPALAALGAAGIGSGPVPVAIRVGDPALPAEGYRLDVDTTGVRIVARDAAGASYALRSLVQQARQEQRRIAPLSISDAPRLGYRGLHIDLARNFHGKAQLLRLVEQMAALKLNRLHLHLGDDEGWRMQIPALPELTTIGGYRCLSLSDADCLQPQLGADPARDAAINGYLTTADYLDILRAATARQITVIPSFDMPGHSRAAIKAMEVRYRRLAAAGRIAEAERYRLVEPADTTRYRSIQNYDDNTLNVCIPQTYRFVETVVAAMARLHAQAGVPLKLYHIGADETAGAWTASPACLTEAARTGSPVKELGARFVERVSAMLAARGIEAAAWSDGLTHADPARLPQRMRSFVWGGLFNGGVREAHTHAGHGWDVVLSLPDITYFDMPQAVSPDEPGATWATRELDLFRMYAFMPGNLPANAAVTTDINNRPATIADAVPLAAGRSIGGIQAQLWSEMVRRDSQVDYMLFPRLFALAERGWSTPTWEPAYVPGSSYAYGDPRVDATALLTGWHDFARRAADQLPALDSAGITYRLAPPGAKVVAGRLEANAELPGMPIEYRVAGGSWTRYSGPVAVIGRVELRTRTSDGRRASRIVSAEPARADWQ